MRNQILTLTATLFAFTAAASALEYRVKADVPFAFNVSGATLPAGEYEIRPVVSQNSTRVFEIRNTETKQSALFVPHSKQQSNAQRDTAALDFRCGSGPCELVALTHSVMPYTILLHAASKPAPTGAKTVRVALLPAGKRS